MRLARAIEDVKKTVRHCQHCFTLCDGELCQICADPRRERQRVLVVEQPKDLIALEQTGMYKGLYHVLMGRLVPLDGVGPDALTIDRLLERIDHPQRFATPGGETETITEVILGLNPTLEGDGTALYLADALKGRAVTVSRLARGLPTGWSLEFANKAMKLAPRMIQSMEILQMPLAELEERIEQELETNPTLELLDQAPEEGEREYDDAPERDAPTDMSDTSRDDKELVLDTPDDFARLDDYGEANPEAVENEFSESRSDSNSPLDRRLEPGERRSQSGERDAKTDAMASISARGPSMREQLLDQWRLVDVDERLRPVGALVIEALDDDGYLRQELGTVGQDEKQPPTPESLEMALEAVQMLLDPPGVAARDARECLLLQIDAQSDRPAAGRIADADDLALARVIADKGLDDLAKNRLPRIGQATGLDMDQIKRGVETLRRLSLAPARVLSSEGAEPIIPDAIVEYDEEGDRYVAYLSDSRASSLRINREYALMAKDRAAPKRDRDFLKKNLSNAQWLLDAVEQRRSTLLRVINVVIAEQREFFDYGPEALRPLPMTQVAEQLGVHVATVSRAVADKHLLSPRGVVPLRGFFTGGLATESGEEVSANAVRAALQEILDTEDKAKPLSDEALSKALKERGYDIARRTVAKYRGQMDAAGAGPASKVVRAQRSGVLHGSITIATPERTVLERHSGRLAHPDRERVDAETTYRIASLTKLFTQLCVLELVEGGELDLDAPVSAYRPELDAPWKDRVTIRQLLAMTSGLPRELHDSPERGVEYDEQGLAGAYLDAHAGIELAGEPGSAHAYSNVGYWLVGSVIEAITGECFVDTVNRLVLQPLGENPVALSPETLGQGAAAGHVVRDGDTARVPNTPMDQRYASGGLAASIAQVRVAALATLDDRLLEEESRELLFSRFGTDEPDGRLMVAGMVPGFMNLVMVDREAGIAVVSLNNRIAENPNAFMASVRGILDEACE
eukprot:g5484.t1